MRALDHARLRGRSLHRLRLGERRSAAEAKAIIIFVFATAMGTSDHEASLIG